MLLFHFFLHAQSTRREKVKIVICLPQVVECERLETLESEDDVTPRFVACFEGARSCTFQRVQVRKSFRRCALRMRRSFRLVLVGLFA